MLAPNSLNATDGTPHMEELREAYGNGDLIVFAGAGISAAAGLPSWKKLVDLLLEKVKARQSDPAYTTEIQELIVERRYIDALSAAKDALGAPAFGSVVERCLDDRILKLPIPDVVHAIAALEPKLRAVLTTNLDHLLERAFRGDWPPLSVPMGDIARRRRFILKLHGTLSDRDTWVFTREDYDRAMYASPQLERAFTALFNACPLLFVGYGLIDDDFDAVLSRVRLLAGEQPPTHFALVSEDSVRPSRRRRLEDSGIRLITYKNPDGRHGEVVRILKELAANS